MAAKEGMNYAPKGKPAPVVKPGEFVFSVIGLDHNHIYGMTNGLLEAGATLRYVYDPDPEKVAAYRLTFPQAQAAESEEQVLSDKETKLVAGACVTSERAALGIRVMKAGKDYFTDKAPLTTLEQLADVKKPSRRRAANTASISASGSMWRPPSMPASSSRPGPSAAWCRSSAWGRTA